MANNALHRDQQIPTVNEIAIRHNENSILNSVQTKTPLISHMSSVTISNNLPRRLKKKIAKRQAYIRKKNKTKKKNAFPKTFAEHSPSP